MWCVSIRREKVLPDPPRPPAAAADDDDDDEEEEAVSFTPSFDASSAIVSSLSLPR